MGAAVTLRNVVGVAEHGLLIGIVPLQRYFDANRSFLHREMKHRRMNRTAGSIEVGDKGLQTALVLENVTLVITLVDQLDSHS